MQGNASFAMKQLTNIFGEINESLALYENTYAARESEDENVITPMTVSAGLPVNEIFLNDHVKSKHDKYKATGQIDTVMRKGSKHCIVTLIE